MKRTQADRDRLQEDQKLQQKLFKAPDEDPAGEDASGMGILNVYNLRSWWNAILSEPAEN
jgi:hypothetical protein